MSLKVFSRQNMSPINRLQGVSLSTDHKHVSKRVRNLLFPPIITRVDKRQIITNMALIETEDTMPVRCHLQISDSQTQISLKKLGYIQDLCKYIQISPKVPFTMIQTISLQHGFISITGKYRLAQEIYSQYSCSCVEIIYYQNCLKLQCYNIQALHRYVECSNHHIDHTVRLVFLIHNIKLPKLSFN